MTDGADARVDELRAQARYHRERYDLYRAKTYGPRPTTLGRMRELEQACQSAEARLAHAESESARRVSS